MVKLLDEAMGSSEEWDNFFSKAEGEKIVTQKGYKELLTNMVENEEI